MRDALAGEPLDLLAMVSSLLCVFDPRERDPFETAANTRPGTVDRDEVLRSFFEVDLPETSALLAVIAGLVDDELLRARVVRELAVRKHPLPGWLTNLRDARPTQAIEMVEPLRDGDNVIIGATLADGFGLTAVVYIDHNVGTLVKDAFVIPQPIDEVLPLMRAAAEDPDVSWNAIEAANARARIDDAIDIAAMTYPRFESDTWPACRALVEWMVRLLPPGGTGYEPAEWDEQSLSALADDFFASPYATKLDDPDHRSLLDSFMWFATDYGPGDPLRWSPVSIEILLTDWLPRKVLADAAYLANTSTLLQAFVRYSHDQRGVRPARTTETLQAIDSYEPTFLDLIENGRRSLPRSVQQELLEQMLAGPAGFGLLDEDALDEDFESHEDYMLGVLRRAVGDDLDRLDDTPLPDEAFDWTGIPDDVHDRVSEVLDLCDACCDTLLDTEHRTACRRLLARCAAGDPAIFRRTGRANTAAAAVCWIIGKANDAFSYYGNLAVKDLTAHFELGTTSVSQRATALLRAGGFPTETYGGIKLGDPRYLVSARRHRIIEQRNRYCDAQRRAT